MTTPEQIDLWRQAASEHQRLEFKEAKQQFDFGKLQQYCVALANEGGGTLLLGVADKPPRPVRSFSSFQRRIFAPAIGEPSLPSTAPNPSKKWTGMIACAPAINTVR